MLNWITGKWIRRWYNCCETAHASVEALGLGQDGDRARQSDDSGKEMVVV